MATVLTNRNLYGMGIGLILFMFALLAGNSALAEDRSEGSIAAPSVDFFNPRRAFIYSAGVAHSYLAAMNQDGESNAFSTEGYTSYQMYGGLEQFFWNVAGVQTSLRLGLQYMQKGYRVQGYTGYQDLAFHLGGAELLAALAYGQIATIGVGLFRSYLVAVQEKNTGYSNEYLYRLFSRWDRGLSVKVALGYPLAGHILFVEYAYHYSFSKVYQTMLTDYRNIGHFLSIGLKRLVF